MCLQFDNRAVSALFLIFGGPGKCRAAETCLHTGFHGMHVAERLVLAIWVPLSVFVATGYWLCEWLGVAAGLALVLPAGFLMLNLLPCAMAGMTPVSQWRRWLALGALWGLFYRDAGGVVSWCAWGWIGLFLTNLAALLLLGIRHMMEWKGSRGIAVRVFLLLAAHAAAIVAGVRWGWPWAVMGGAIIAALYCLAVLRPGCQWLGPVRCRNDDRRILITIDDGPDPDDTPKLLDLLDEHQVKALFFMIGEKAAAHPGLVREVVRRGHEIGNHTMTHPQASFWCAGPWRTRREIAACQRVIEEITGVKPRWFRAPVGHRNLFTHPIAGALGLEIMAWNRRGFDAVERDVRKVLDRLLPGLGHGDIILVHEATPIAAEVLQGVLSRMPWNESGHGDR